MTRKCLAVAAAVIALAVPAFADVPDGQGGRTSVWGLSRPAHAAAPHFCCKLDLTPTAARRVASSPAEIKAIGHAAWVDRGDVAGAPIPCYKRIAYRPVPAASPVEAKALAHVARNPRPAAEPGRSCCESGRCPMRARVNASR